MWLACVVGHNCCMVGGKCIKIPDEEKQTRGSPVLSQSVYKSTGR